MAELRFTKDHEFIRVEGEVGVVGISDYAQGQLGDVVYVELPQTGKSFARGDEVAVVESVKAASEIYAPVSGEIVETNGDLEENPGRVNEDPFGDGWFFKMRIADASELAGLMSEADYQAYVKEL